ncbi:FUSC family protein [Maridesulfovibrio zosterae]|uniref:FUSC family protein n=1 Tax=Maridesulfovibrio zosterae TaxID=82171 RepID=UPI000417A7C3|nr:FUSC family protein [Maridesulfovibrio zosterae]
MKQATLNTHKAHTIHGIKTGAAAVLAYVAANMLDLKFGYWAALSAVIVMQINVADSIRMCWYRFSGTAIGAFIGIICIMGFPQTHYMTTLALFLSVGFCAYMTRYNERYKMAAITTTIVTLASLGEPNRIEYGLFRVIEIGLGVGSAFLVNILVWPMRAAETLKDDLFRQFEECAENYEMLMENFLQKQTGLAPSMLDTFNSRMSKNREIYSKVIRLESLLYIEDTQLLGMKIETLEKCASHLRAMLHALNNVHGEGYDIIMQDELRLLARTTSRAMRSIGSKKIPDEKALQYALDSAQNRLEELRNEGVTRRFYLQKMVQFFAFYHSAQFICKDLLYYTQERKRIKNKKAATKN